MKLEVPIEEMRKKKIFVATPMYGGQCHGMNSKANIDLQAMALHHGIEIKFFFLFNESLITRARNYLVDEFMRSGFTHLMFIDSDICFNPNDVLCLAALSDELDPNDEHDIVCGPYPKKCIAWERIAAAVKAGLADEDPGMLEQLVGDYVFNPVGGTNRIHLGEPVEVLEGGTGFMMIKRQTFVKWADAYPGQLYTPDHNRSEHFDGSRKITAYFDTVIDPNQNRYLSEDYMFCQWSRNIGLKVWMCPWMNMVHVGTFNFAGNMQAISQVPNASHGGMIDQQAVQAAGQTPWNPGIPKPQAPPMLPGSPTVPILPPPQNFGGGQFTPPVANEEMKNRAERRREEMKKRREAKKTKKVTKKSPAAKKKKKAAAKKA